MLFCNCKTCFAVYFKIVFGVLPAEHFYKVDYADYYQHGIYCEVLPAVLDKAIFVGCILAEDYFQIAETKCAMECVSDNYIQNVACFAIYISRTQTADKHVDEALNVVHMRQGEENAVCDTDYRQGVRSSCKLTPTETADKLFKDRCTDYC